MPAKDVPEEKTPDSVVETTTDAVARKSAPLLGNKPSAETDDAAQETTPIRTSARKVVIAPIHTDVEADSEDPEPTVKDVEEPADEGEQQQPVEEPQAKDTDETVKKSDISVDEAVAAETARDERTKKVAELVHSEQYFVPINAAGARRNRRRIIGGVFVLVLLVLAWYNLSLDAHLLPNTFDLPHTDLFGGS